MVKARLTKLTPELIVRLLRHILHHLFGYLVMKPR